MIIVNIRFILTDTEQLLFHSTSKKAYVTVLKYHVLHSKVRTISTCTIYTHRN